MFGLVSRHAAARRSAILLDSDAANRGNASNTDLSVAAAQVPEPRLRGIIGYHNAFDDGASQYDVDEINRLLSSGLNNSPPEYPAAVPEPIPAYDCTVLKQGPVSMKVERKSPFDFVQQPQWFEAYAVLRGTMLNIHLPKQSGFLSSRPDKIPDGTGKLLKSYTLQHAEAGLAADHKKVEMVPKNPVTSLLPEAAIEHLKETDPHLFEHKHIYVIRLRLETDQLLLRFKSSEARSSWLSSICAAMDLAPAIEDRTEPRYQTLPRRSRRRREVRENVQLDDTTLLEQQQRIAREQFPHLFRGGNREEPHAEGVEAENSSAAPASMDNRDADADELDNSIFATSQAPSSSVRPTHNFGRLVSSVNRIFGDRSTAAALREVNVQHLDTVSFVTGEQPVPLDPISEPSPDEEEEDGKWNPNTYVDPVREARCIRRCMPTLLFNSRRANRLIIKDGVRMHIDWERKVMVPYSAAPPSYDESQQADAESDVSESEPIETPGALDLLRTITEQQDGPDYASCTERNVSVTGSERQLAQHVTEEPRDEVEDCATSGSSGDDSHSTHKRPGWFSRLRKASKPGLRSKAGTDRSHKASLEIDFAESRVAQLKDAQRPITPFDNTNDTPFVRVGLI